MEIISYVEKSPKRPSFNLFNGAIGAFNIKKRYKAKTRRVNDVSYSFSYPEERYTFKAGKVRKPFSVRMIFAGIGRGVSLFGAFLKQNIKTIALMSLILALVFAAGIFALNIYFFHVNHTGPVLLNYSESADFEHLDNFMSSFALDDSLKVDSDGKLLDADFSVDSSIIVQAVTYQNYKVKSGDTISGITKKFGLSNISTLIAVNDISNVRQLAAGQKLKIPSMDGIVYTVQKGDSINSIVGKYNVKMEALLDANELSSEELTVGQVLFIPGAALDRKTLQNAMGELFILPISAAFRWSSPYGWRADPFTGVRSFHTGTDMACPQGTPILASQSGRVSAVSSNRVYGNYVIIDHGNGYQTLYAHMYKALVKKGAWVSQGTRIGLVGSTGYSTGPHLHFMVYKNGTRIDPMTILKR